MKKLKYINHLFHICFLVLSQIGCNFVHLQERFLERSIRQSGLVMKEIDLGPDHIAYWEGGSGPTLLLLHGFGANATFGWSEQISILSQHFHLIIPDLLWFGRSRSSQADFSVKHQARAIQHLLANIGVMHFNVAGISYGGIVALLLMSKAPEQINRAVIISSPGPTYTQKDYEALLKRFDVKSASELVLPTTSAGLTRLLEIAYRDPPYMPLVARADVIDFLQDKPSGEKTALLAKLMTDFEQLKNEINHFSGKTLIIWGSDDKLFPLELGRRLKNYFGNKAKLKIISKARHAPNIEFCAEFNQAILDFFK